MSSDFSEVTEGKEVNLDLLENSANNSDNSQFNRIFPINGHGRNVASSLPVSRSHTADDSNSSPPSNLGVAMGNREHSFFKSNSDRSLFLRDLPFHFRDEHLREFIVSLMGGKENTVELCRVKYSAKHGKTLQVGFVMMRTPEESIEIHNVLTANPRCCGRDLRVCYFDATPTSELSQNGAVQFTFDADFIQPQITEEYVRDNFEASYGKIESICIRGHFFKQNRQNGYGFILLDCKEHEEKLKQGAVLQVDRVVYHFTNAKIKDREGDNQYYAFSNRSHNRRDHTQGRSNSNNHQIQSNTYNNNIHRDQANFSRREERFMTNNSQKKFTGNNAKSQEVFSQNSNHNNSRNTSNPREYPMMLGGNQSQYQKSQETFFQHDNHNSNRSASDPREYSMMLGGNHSQYLDQQRSLPRLGARDPYDYNRNSTQSSMMNVPDGTQPRPGYRLVVVPVADSDVGYEMNTYPQHLSPTNNVSFNPNMAMAPVGVGRQMSPVPNSSFNVYDMQQQMQMRQMSLSQMQMSQHGFVHSNNPVENRNLMMMMPPDRASQQLPHFDGYGMNYPMQPPMEEHAYRYPQHQHQQGPSQSLSTTVSNVNKAAPEVSSNAQSDSK